MPPVRLLNTDFDGTLIGHPSDGKCTPDLARALAEHQGRGGLWAINTGRSLEHILEGIEILAPPILPDFLLIHEREVYRRGGGHWESHGSWNDSCRERHRKLNDVAGAIFPSIQKIADESGNSVTLVYENGVPAGLVTTGEDVMDAVTGMIEQASISIPDFFYQRNSIYLRFCHREYHKGAVLSELCRLENIRRDEVFSIGDHYNDLSMLDGLHAGMTACPANAIEPVKAAVRRSGGYVAENPWGDGVAEALRFFEDSLQGGWNYAQDRSFRFALFARLMISTQEPAWCEYDGASLSLKSNDVHLWEIVPSHSYAANLTPGEANRYIAIVNEEVKISYATAQGGLRKIVSLYAGKRPEEIKIERGPNGKPFTADGPAFNVSHTAGRVFAAFSAVDVGFDVESASRRVSALELAQRFFLKSEIAHLLATDSRHQTLTFLRYWVCKESMVKLSGDGIYLGLRDALVNLGERRYSRGEYRNRSVDLLELCPGEGLVAALAAWQRVEVKCFFRL